MSEQAKPKLLFLPGMGSDSRLYHGIQIPEYEKHFIDWIPPDPKESLRSYAKRLIEPIGKGPFVCLGSSFGGVVSLELSMLVDVKHVILIGAPREKVEFSQSVQNLLRFGSGLRGLTNFVPNTLVTRILQVRDTENKSLFRQMLQNSPIGFMPFAIKSLSSWNEKYAVPTTQLIGESDWIVSKSHLSPTNIIKGAGHCAILDQPEEISLIINRIMELNGS